MFEFQVWKDRPPILKSRPSVIEDLMADLDYPDKSELTEEERVQIRKDYESLPDEKLSYEWLLRFS